MLINFIAICSEGAYGMANSVNFDQTALEGVHTAYPVLSVQICSIITVYRQKTNLQYSSHFVQNGRLLTKNYKYNQA